MANPSDILRQAVQGNLLPEASADAAYAGKDGNPYANAGSTLIRYGDKPGDVFDPLTDPAYDLRNSALVGQPQAKPAESIYAPPGPVEQKQTSLLSNTASKRDAVVSASAAKQQAMSPQQYFQNAVSAATGKGLDSASQLEKDLQGMSPLEIRHKYGDQADALIAGQARGMGELTQANTRGQRTATQLWDDFNVNFGQGLANTVGGVAALGAGVVSKELGTGAAGLLNDFNQFMDANQSERLQARKNVMEAKSALTSRDSEAAFAEQVKANAAIHMNEVGVVGQDRADTRQAIRDGSAKLARELANFGKAIVNASEDPATLGSGIANAGGSFVGVGPVGKAIKAATAGKLGTTAAIGATEAGGSYAQATSEVMGKTHEELMQTSAPYRDMIAGGTSPEEAKQAVANQTGLLAATITAPAAIAAGRLVHNFEGNVAGFGSGRKLVGNSLRETGEEGIQSSAGQLAQNIAAKTLVDPNTDLGAGVGRQGGEGALFGMGMTAAIGAPSVVRDGVAAAGSAALNLLDKRLASVMDANNKASPVADATVAQAAAHVEATAPQAEASLREAVATSVPAEQQAQATSYVDSLLAANKYTPAEAPAAFHGDLADVTNRVGAIQRMAELVDAAPEGSNEQLRAGFYLNTLLEDYSATLQKDPAALASLAPDSEAAGYINHFRNLVSAIQQTPSVSGAVATVRSMIENSDARKADVTPETLATPEGQQAVQDVIGVAQVAPEKVDLGTAEQILFQVSQGNLQVTPAQKAALDTSVALLRATQEADKAAVAAGKSNAVSLNISSVQGEKGKSLTQHAKDIMSAWKTGNRDLAASNLTDLHNFAKGMSNKVAAINSHFAAGSPKGDGVRYEVFVGGTGVPSAKGVHLHRNNTGSVEFAQEVAREAKLLADVYNGLVTAFPDLNGQHLNVTPLDAQLIGPSADVVAKLQTPATTPVVKADDTTAPVKTAPTPKQADTPNVKEVSSKVETPAPTETVADPVVKEEPVVAEPAPAPKAEPKVKGMAAAFSHLLNAGKNQFIKSFRIPAKAKTRIFANEGPLSTIVDALSNGAAFTAFLGSSPKGKFDADVANAYQLYLGNAPEFLDGLHKRLDAYLNKPYSKKDGRTIGEILATDAEVLTQKGELFEPMRTVDGKALNIAEVVDGKVVYSPELIEGAVLAGLQWLLVSNDYASVVDEKDVAAQTGLDESAITPGLIGLLSQGLSVGEAKRSLAAKIRNYWGVSGENTGTIGNIEGIPEAIAAELLAYMRDSGDIVELNFSVLENGKVVEYSKADGVPHGHRKPIDRLVPQTKNFPQELRKFPDAIEQAILVTPEETQYIGEDARPPVAKTQLRNPLVENTAEQQQVMQTNGDTPYTVNTFMGAFYSALGKDNFLSLFGAGKFDKANMNVNHALSLEGKNQGAAAAYDHMMGTFERIENVGPIGETPIRYPFNTSRVSRLQMLGKFSPQANKQVREAILPTWSTLDLTEQNGRDYHRFAMGMAQALGIKIHNKMPDVSRDEVQALLDGALKPAVALMQNWLRGHRNAHVTNPVYDIQASTVNELVDTFKKAGVGPVSAVGLHAVMEYARYLNTKDKSSFRTALYVEADGMTNGPFNAMGLYTTGEFTVDWLRNMAKGGWFVNRPGMTANQWRSFHDKEDLYTETATKLQDNLVEMRKSLKNNPKMLQHFDHLLGLMDLFFGKDLSFNDNGDLVIQRGATKNPLTITIYGSGAQGIAGNMISTLTDAIYERMSEVSLAQVNGTASSWAEAMFGSTSATPEEAQAKLERFQVSMDALTNFRVVNYKGNLRLKYEPVGTKEQTPRTYTLTVEQLGNMQSAMLEMFVAPLRTAIETTVGKPLMNTVTVLRMAVQAQSIVLEHAFKAEIKAIEEKKAKTDPNWKKGDFLTQGEMAEVYKKLEHLAPFVKTSTQTFFIGGGEVSDIASQFGGALDGSYRTPGFVYGPSDAGVAGIPYLTIGPGDAQMVQNYSVNPDRATGSLPIFDGINMPLDQIEKGSIAANKAVADSLQGNPLAAVHKTFSEFMKAADLSEMGLDQAEALTRALFPSVPRGTIAPVDAIVKRMEAIEDNLNERQQSIEARHRVMAKVALSVDQMAAVASPYQQDGQIQLEGSEFDELAPQLNNLLDAELAAVRKEQNKSEAIGSAIKELATLHESGAYVLTNEDLPALVQATNLPDDQAAILQQIISSMATKGYKVVFGGRAEIAQYNRDSGYSVQSSRAMENAMGYTSVGTKTVYLINPSSETLVHELIHASTFETVLSHYADPAFAKANPQGAKAVQRIEALMNQFLDIELSQVSPELQQAYTDATAAIRGYMGQATAQNKAAALNEFMAWALSNRALASLGKRTLATRLAQLAESAYQAIKSMFFRGQRVAPEKGKDLFSNLLFNSSMLMYSQPSLSQRFNASALFQNSIYGTNERLSEINAALHTTLGRYLDETPKAGRMDPVSAQLKGIENGYRVAQSFLAHGFNMNMQEASTFSTIVTALSTEASIDPNSMAAVQQLYSHVMKSLTPESFMQDPVANDPNDRAQANDKFDVLSGKFLVTRDALGRSSLLPAFLALATTNDEFRAVLEKLDLPKAVGKNKGTLDSVLENYSNKLMGSLGRRMSGQGNKPANVQQAIDALNAYMAMIINKRETFIDQMANGAHGLVDRANEIMTSGFTALAGHALKFSKKAQRPGASKLEQTVAGIGAGIAAVIDEDVAGAVAEGTMAALNKRDVWSSVHRLISDLVGRTKENANVYDMIKAVRSVVQRTRQQYRENLPKTIKSKFSRKLDAREWTSLHTSMGKTDLAALMGNMSATEALALVTNPAKLAKAIAGLEQGLSKLHIQKSKQLAHYMATGNPGVNLLRNAEAISPLLYENYKGPVADVNKIDQLVTLYAIDSLSQEDKDTLASLVRDESDGLVFTLSYLKGQREEELRKATGAAKYNAAKGYIPTQTKEGVSMLVADDSEFSRLKAMSYERVGAYLGSSIEAPRSRGYYYIPVAAKATFEQGIMQNVRQTSGGVDAGSGFMVGQTAGRITEGTQVKDLVKRLHRDTAQNENLVPVFSEQGVIIGFERSLDPVMMERLTEGSDLAETLGMWRGRQVEEGFSQAFNETLIDHLHTMHEKDLTASLDNARQYVDVFNSSDAVLKDAVKLFTPDTRAYIESKFGKQFFVRKDMLEDALGYRAASIGDAWTGNTRWSPETQKAVRNMAIAAMGNDAYKTVLNAEKLIQNVVSDAKVLIVVKSVIVPAVNIISNFYQLASRGVPVKFMATAMPKKLAEIDMYTRSLVRLIEAEAELRAAAGDVRVERRLKTEIQAITDSHKRMTIWPLIEAGEFSGISDAGITHEDTPLTSGRMQAYLESLVNKLPDGAKTLGRYALITKDTALYQGLQKSVEYGDFIAKAVLFEDLVQRRGLSKADALARITEEFVNYDRLSGRFRGTLENLGLLWFYNFKIRIVKVALSTIRNNPVHALLTSLTPTPSLFGSVGLPLTDNMFTKLANGTLDSSMGPGQGLHAMQLNPWLNLLN